jgi:hypothetical protein
VKEKPKPKDEPEISNRPIEGAPTMEQFGKFVKRIMSVPKEEIDKREKKWKNRK